MIEQTTSSGLAVLRLAHGKASALDLELVHALAARLDELARGDMRAVVLTGTGSIFSAGVDLFKLVDGGSDYVARFLPAMDRMFETLFTFPAPVVAAVNGHAIAGGCILACCCDRRLMADGRARIGLPERAGRCARPRGDRRGGRGRRADSPRGGDRGRACRDAAPQFPADETRDEEALRRAGKSGDGAGSRRAPGGVDLERDPRRDPRVRKLSRPDLRVAEPSYDRRPVR